jgi:hypothetical protein
MTGVTMPMLSTQLGLLDQAMQAYLGYPREALNQTAQSQYANTIGTAGALGGLGSIANAGGFGAILGAL